MSYRKLWIALGLVLIVSFAVLGGVGIKVMHNAPPIPSAVVTTNGQTLFDGTAIMNGCRLTVAAISLAKKSRCVIAATFWKLSLLRCITWMYRRNSWCRWRRG